VTAGLQSDTAQAALAEHVANMRTLRQPPPATTPPQPTDPAARVTATAPDPALDRIREVNRIGGWLADAATRHLFESSGTWLISGDEYSLATEEQMRALGEDPDDPAQQLILCRKRDGAFFEIDVDVCVSETSVQGRKEQRERYARRPAT
jgi:hypothetical protein